jgi:hypothetical protein
MAQRGAMWRWVGSVLLVAALCAPTAAAAQEQARVLALVTEEVSGEGATGVTYWWQDMAARRLSGTDEALRGALSAQGVSWEEPAAGVVVSKIYRVARLTLANATALAGVLGTRGRVVVGRVRYERVGALMSSGWLAQVEVELVEPGWRPGGQTVRITLERASYGEDADAGLSGLKAEVGAAVGRLVAGWVKRGEGPVGVSVGERLVVIRGGLDGAGLEGAMRALRGVPGVSGVQVRWAARGMIALELNPGVVDKAELVEYAARVLIAQEQEPWRLTQAGEQRMADAIVLDVVRAQGDR